MRIVSSAMLIVAGVYLALGLIYLRFWWAERARTAYLAFTISCFSYMLFSWFELGMMHASTPAEYLSCAWWAFFPGSIGLVSFAWFAYLQLHGSKLLFVTYAALRMLAVLLQLIMANGINFRQVTSVVGRTVLGETLSYPIAVPNPWMVLPHISHVLLIVFFLDASVRCWRHGERRQAITFGTATILFGTTVLGFSLSVLWGLVPVPIMGSFAVLFIVAAVLYELNYELHHAAMLTEKLAERDARLTETLEQLQLSAAAANVGMWTRKVGEETIWVSEKAGEIWGHPSGEQFLRDDFLQHIHPDDLPALVNLIRELEEGRNEFQLEYRTVSQDGNVRWVHSRGKVEEVNGARFIRGAIVDITRLKMAEQAIHDLSGKLMNAQEKERARLARELHDDLSQSIALLSIKLATLRNEPKDLAYVKDQLDQFVSDLDRLSVDVHRISHELHPARLNHLGLETALRGFCRELSAAHALQVDFEAENLPRDLPDDISLCLYRVTQESLQNIIKHSGAAAARVSVKLENGEIRLSVSDDGSGFDPSARKAKEALGLISIDERVRAVKGEAKVISAVGAGTKIEVHIPVGNHSEDGINNKSKNQN
ncbi:MAG TPA: PAS domain-containing protein [Pyrinomonadaceae bacterium]|jgi:PAS domain S-box-containing protein|nr:PAS domain-containing protein [Pyrinomonadaceae bacterium]